MSDVIASPRAQSIGGEPAIGASAGQFRTTSTVTSARPGTLVAGHLPGPGTAFPGARWTDADAAQVDGKIAGRGGATSVRDDKPICMFAASVMNAAGGVRLSGTTTSTVSPKA